MIELSESPAARRRRLFLALGCAMGFALVAWMVASGRARSLDASVLSAFRRSDTPELLRGPAWVAGSTRDLTALGGLTLGVCVVVVVSVGFAALGHRARVWALVATYASGYAMSKVLKWCSGLPRPQIVPHLADSSGASFPSGHAMMAAVLYLALADLLTEGRHGRAERTVAFCLAGLAVVVVGASRVLLGVHYPSDVLAGWLAGAAWVALVAWMRHRLSYGRHPRQAAG